MRFDNDSYDIDVGTFVMNNHHGLLRMGVVEDKRIDESGWVYFKVKFLEDDVYYRNKKFHSKISGKDEFQYEHRVDQLKKVNPQWLENVLTAYGEYEDERRTEFS
ncbi:MAG TPA: hypothetical protein DCL39_00455 [Alteromonas macleodii]|nr:hypothetical protein [Alteromonas macleodii]|tara:strand:- start:2368 stop:2682 length:315 start_codon:yes stop_codon:yes gene_type:complete